MPRVVHFERLGVHQRVALAVVLTIGADGDFDVLGEGEIEGERVVAHHCAVSIGVVVGHHVEECFARGGIDDHNSSYEDSVLPSKKVRVRVNRSHGRGSSGMNSSTRHEL